MTINTKDLSNRFTGAAALGEQKDQLEALLNSLPEEERNQLVADAKQQLTPPF